MYQNDQQLKIKLLMSVVSVFIVLIAVFYYILYKEERAILSEKIQEKKELAAALFHQVNSDINKEMMIILENVVHNNSIVDAVGTNNREELLKYTFQIFRLIKKENPEYAIMEFHRADGTSLLKLHDLKKQDDNLPTSREMLKTIHHNHIRLWGFEIEESAKERLIYRVIMPIFNREAHYIGAVELGIDAQVFVERLKNTMVGNKEDGAFYISKKRVDRSGKTLKYYVQTNVTDGFIARDIYDSMSFNPYIVHENEQSFMIEKKEDFLKDYQNNSVGTVVMQFNLSEELRHFEHFLHTILILLLLLFSAIVLQIYYGFNRFIEFIEIEREKVAVKKNKLVHEQNKVQSILNAQSNIIILTDGRELKIANQAFLDFFSIIELSDFTNKYSCICDFFIEHADFFSLHKISQDKNWVVYLKNQPLEERRVTMLNSNNEARAFELHIKHYELEHKLYVIEFHDITEMMIEQKKLYNEANTDKLTNIFNRNYFLSKLRIDIEKVYTKEAKLSLIMFDIDHFKNVNDTYGHDVGDKVLQKLTNVIGENLRDEDTFARWGGEEFLILLPNAQLQIAEKIAEKLRYIVELIEEKELPSFTCSFGVVEFYKGQTSEQFLKHVDEALYEAKESGRNRVVVH